MAGYFITAKKTYTEVGVVIINKHIRDMLSRHSLRKCKVNTVALSPLKVQQSVTERNKVYGRVKFHETNETLYYAQEFVQMKTTLVEYTSSRNIFLKYIDLTMD